MGCAAFNRFSNSFSSSFLSVLEIVLSAMISAIFFFIVCALIYRLVRGLIPAKIIKMLAATSSYSAKSLNPLFLAIISDSARTFGFDWRKVDPAAAAMSLCAAMKLLDLSLGKPDLFHRCRTRPLRACCKRPRGGRSADDNDEFAAFHGGITWLAGRHA